MYIPFLFSSKRDTLLRKQKAYVFHFFLNSNCNFFENGCICIYIGALGSVSVMRKKYVLALWQYNARDWFITHMKQKRPCFWTSKLRLSITSYRPVLALWALFFIYFSISSSPSSFSDKITSAQKTNISMLSYSCCIWAKFFVLLWTGQLH